MPKTPVEIVVLGPGCANCARVELNVERALVATRVEGVVSKVTDYGEIARWGVIATPGLAVDGTVVVMGRVPSVEEIADLLRDAASSTSTATN